MRHVRAPDGSLRTFAAPRYASAAWRAARDNDAPLPDYLVDGTRVPPRDHLLMQAALQPHVDGGISKTVALAADQPVKAVDELLRLGCDLGLKGCTIYRAGTRRAVVGPNLATSCRS